MASNTNFAKSVGANAASTRKHKSQMISAVSEANRFFTPSPWSASRQRVERRCTEKRIPDCSLGRRLREVRDLCEVYWHY
jgi:hypothetical protein